MGAKGEREENGAEKRNPGLREKTGAGEAGAGNGDSRDRGRGWGSERGSLGGWEANGAGRAGDSQGRGEDAGHGDTGAGGGGRREAGGGGNPQVWGPGEEGSEIRAQGPGGSPGLGSVRMRAVSGRSPHSEEEAAPRPPTQSPPHLLSTSTAVCEGGAKSRTGFPSQILGWISWDLDSPTPTSSPPLPSTPRLGSATVGCGL